MTKSTRSNEVNVENKLELLRELTTENARLRGIDEDDEIDYEEEKQW